MLDNGENDLRTLHAACPVVHGRKWGEFGNELFLYKMRMILGAVGNRWIREGGQLFKRPCTRTRGKSDESFTGLRTIDKKQCWL